MLNGHEILNVLKKHQDELKKLKVKRIGIFGSYARNEQKSNSDIDFLVDFDETTFDNFMELEFFLERIFRQKIDLVTKNGLDKYIEPIVIQEVKWYE